MSTGPNYSICRVVIEQSLDREFDYSIPAEFATRVQIGCRVEVSFGRRLCYGYVVGLADHSEHPVLKPIQAVVGDAPLFREPMLALARWIADYYLTPLEAVLRTMLPAPVRQVKGEQKLLTVRLVAKPDGISASQLSDPSDAACRPDRPDEHGKLRSVTPRQKLVLDYLSEKGTAPLSEILVELAISEAPVRSLEKRGFVLVEAESVRRAPNADRTVLPTGPLPLMPQQAAALEQIKNMVNRRFAGVQVCHSEELTGQAAGQGCPRPTLDEGMKTAGQGCPRPTLDEGTQTAGQGCPRPTLDEGMKMAGQGCPRPTFDEGTKTAGQGCPRPTLDEGMKMAGQGCPRPTFDEGMKTAGQGCPRPTFDEGTQTGRATASLPRRDVDTTGGKSRGATEPFTMLLYGVTGSGKTEVYLQAIADVRARGLGAIVLVPEIALTPQTVERFLSRFGNHVAVLHSHLTDGERHDEWHRIRSGECNIVVGARSAVFAPMPRLGLIVVDEEHEPSYKQDEAPRYSARDVAVMRGQMEGCVVVLGSATPCLESWHNTRRGKYVLAAMPHRVDHRVMPVMRIVDMRQQSSATGKGGYLSPELMEAVRLRLERGEQVILFHNRRGYATSLQCPKCGFVAQCEHCSVSCTYHRKGEILRCHVCGTDKPVPRVCPGCGDPAYRFAGCGTQRIEEVVRKCFPKAVVERLDSDVTQRRTAHEEILDAFRSGSVHILIGTQMIAKGLHIPNVTLVGVVHADQGLSMPDFRAGERTFQLLAQVGGRAGRGDVPGEVVVQTYSPLHPAIQAARRLDFAGFCDQELAFREELLYPPFSHLACVLVRGVEEEAVANAARDICARVRGAAGKGITISDAAPAPLVRAKNQFRYQVLLRGVSAKSVGAAIRTALGGIKLKRGVVVSVDMDAVHLV